MINTWIGRAEAPRIAAVLTTLLCAHLACSFESLGRLGNGTRQDAKNADANIGIDMVGRAEVAIAADTPLSGSGGKGGDASARIVDPSDAASVSSAGDAAGFGGGMAGVATGGDPMGTGGSASGGDTEADGAAGSGGWTGTGGGAPEDGGGAGDDGAAGSGGWTGTGGGAPEDGGGAGVGGTGGRSQADRSATGGSLPEVDAGADTPQSVDSGAADTPPVVKSVLFVAGAVPLTGGDVVIRSHLRARGFVVTIVEDVDLPAAPKVDESLVLIARDTWSSAIRTKFRTTPVPVLVCEPSLYVDMAMVDRTLGSWGTYSASSLVINPLASPLAAGLTGISTMVNGNEEDMSYGVPSSQAILVATFLDDLKLWSIFAYDTTASMFGLNAPARRGGFFFSKTSPRSLTVEGWLLFDAMVDWLIQ